MVSSECLMRVFQLRVPIDVDTVSLGTCFTMESDKNISKSMKQYLVTARHLFEEVGFPTKSTIQLRIGKHFKSFEANIHYHSNTNVDIAIMDIGEQIFVHFENQRFSNNMILGQDSYILGFPVNVTGSLPLFPPLSNAGVNQIPIIARACFAGTTIIKGVDYILLDGNNNRGFSGGPVCFCTNGLGSTMDIAGVVFGFYQNQLLVHYGSFNKQTNKLDVIGDVTIADAANKNHKTFIEANSGIFIATNIKYAHEIIETIP